MKPWLLIPIFDHGGTISAVVDSLEYLGLPCLIVDDGSGASTRRALDEIEERCDWVTVEHLSYNRGRGAAMRVGFQMAAQGGATHVLHIDADGQHDASDLPRFLEAAAKNPEAMILGQPIFDDSAPWIRVHGRKLSQWCVWLETGSFAIGDPLCGLRCMPLERTLCVLNSVALGDRMDFDPEILVHLAWNGTRVINLPTRVIYPVDGISHFHLVTDNLRMVTAHAKLMVSAAGRLWSTRTQRKRMMSP